MPVEKLSVVAEDYLTVFDSTNTPVTGLVNADFNKSISVNGAPSAVVVTVTEINAVTRPGEYFVTFTPNATGAWYLLINEPTYNKRGWDNVYTVTADGVFDINEIFTKPDMVETGWDLRDTLRVMSAVLCGKDSGFPFAPVFRNLQDTADRVKATVDASGDRTSVTLTP
jgi:hypothetical protein